jgi:hypothetical protein
MFAIHAQSFADVLLNYGRFVFFSFFEFIATIYNWIFVSFPDAENFVSACPRARMV